jgi:mono/diheme cytochrome c family protein
VCFLSRLAKEEGALIRKILWSVAVLGCLLALGLVVTLKNVDEASQRKASAPYPLVQRDTAPGALARGESIFRSTCFSCHRDAASNRASGIRLADMPAAFGEIYAANITGHPEAGIGRLSDAEIARVVRYGVLPDGRRSLMPNFGMGDADLAAVLGFLRSGSPLVAPDPKVVPPSRLSRLGRILVYLSHGDPTRTRPAGGVPTPRAAPTVEYGRYLAYGVYGCADCHTSGFAAEKTRGPEAFAGGFRFRGADGKEIRSPNLTQDGTGLYLWTYADFARTLTEGIRPDGSPIRTPMPRFDVGEVDVRALWVFLKSIPRKQADFEPERPVHWDERLPPPDEPSWPAEMAPAAETPAVSEPSPEQLFGELGCTACHGVGAPYYAQFIAGRNKSPDYLTSWIRHPERLKPGTPMPTFASRVNVTRARRLADWIRTTPPEKLPALHVK